MKPAGKIQHRSRVKALSITVRGAVQGVGFRPFIHRIANEIGLAGWVKNSPLGVFIDVEGGKRKLDLFLRRLNDEKPPLSSFQSLETSFHDAEGHHEFRILQSGESGRRISPVPPDTATCPDCLREINDANDRRYHYPFTNCANCGPRYSIIEAIPYDRRNSSMKKFRMCNACFAEFSDPSNRRFHAQPNACPQCGPELAFWDCDGHVGSDLDDPLMSAAQAIRDGDIVALKGLGGFQLLADARNTEAVNELRLRKNGDEKPFAVMFPSVASIERSCTVSREERLLLMSPESPIVLLEKSNSETSEIAETVAPRCLYLGSMLPYSPLHHLLMAELGFPVVAAGASLAEEPVCIDEHEAVNRLKGVADHYLVHDLPIVRPIDDSIARVVLGRPMVLRRARGYAPLAVELTEELPDGIAVGCHLMNTVAVSRQNRVFISQHIGDMDTEEAYGAFRRSIGDLERLFEINPDRVAHDRHPDHLSTGWANSSSLKTHPVQHHYAHVLSCMAENGLSGPVLGIAWDGTGAGVDGNLWGSEFLKVQERGFTRFAHFSNFPLPGGDAAALEPRRSAIGLLYSIFGDKIFDRTELEPIRAFDPSEMALIRRMLDRGINSPLTAAAGKLFDAVASIIGLRQMARFEGQTAMELEYIADTNIDSGYPIKLTRVENAPALLDTSDLIKGVLIDLVNFVPNPVIAARFHNTLIEAILRVARLADEKTIALSGDCFQSKRLTESAVSRLLDEGFDVYWQRDVPTNDGGIALGQLMALAPRSQKE